MARRLFNVCHVDFCGLVIEVLSYGHHARSTADGIRQRLAKMPKHKDHILVVHDVLINDSNPFEMGDGEEWDSYGVEMGEYDSVRASRPSQS